MKKLGIIIFYSLFFCSFLISYQANAGEFLADEMVEEILPIEEKEVKIDYDSLYGSSVYSLMSFSGGNSFRFSLTSQEIPGGSNLSDFPIYYNLANAPVEFWENVKENGGDIIITDIDDNRLPLEIVSIATSTMTGEIYFAGELLASSSVFYVNYGNVDGEQPAEDEQYGSQDVWNADYRGVWHLNENANNTAGNYKDSTGYNIDGTGANLIASSSPAGKIGKSFWGTGGDGSGTMRIAFPGTNLNFSVPVSISSFIYSRKSGYNGWYWGKTENNWDLRGSGIDNSNHLWWNATAGDDTRKSTQTITSNTWQYITAKIDEYGDLIYCVSDVCENATGGNLEISGGTASFTVGTGADTGYESFYGFIDEVRITDTARSDDWIKAEYLNLNNNTVFFTGGEQEEEEENATSTPMTYLSGATSQLILFINFIFLLIFIFAVIWLVIKKFLNSLDD